MKHILRLLLSLAAALAWTADGPARAAAPAPADTAPRRITVLQWNVWQEGTQVDGGYAAIVNEIVRLRPDFITLSEVRNYRGTDFIGRLCADLAIRGERYYGFPSYDSGILSRYPVDDSLTVWPCRDDHGSIYRLRCRVGGRRVAVYTAHLDYLDDAYYNVRGYDGSTWQETPIPRTAGEVLERNARSRRDEAGRAFIACAGRDVAEGYAVLLGGDFNEPSHLDWTAATAGLYDHHGLVIAWPLTPAIESAGFTDVYRALHPDPVAAPGITFPADNPLVPVDRLTWAPKADERERIDYIFCGGTGLRPVACTLFGPAGTIGRARRLPHHTAEPVIAPLGTWPSDHRAVIAVFELQ